MLPSFFAPAWNHIGLCELFWRDVTHATQKATDGRPEGPGP
jgi:hypothetical protein